MISDADLEMAVPVPVPTEADPTALGWRYLDGGKRIVPLRPEDLLFQMEDDFIVTNEAHVEDMHHLADILRWRTRNKPGIRIFRDHCIDFQVEGLGILGPDVVLFNGEVREWDSRRGTFPVRDMGARPLYAFEVTSPSTRLRDFRERLDQYFRAGVPAYVIIDAEYGGGRTPQGIVAFQAGPERYERLPNRTDGRFWVEVAEIWISIENRRLCCRLPDGEIIPDRITTRSEFDALRDQIAAIERETEALEQQAEEEERQATEAMALVEQEKRRADAMQAERDELARRTAELEAELRRLRGE